MPGPSVGRGPLSHRTVSSMEHARGAALFILLLMFPCPTCTSAFSVKYLLARHSKQFPDGSCVPRFTRRVAPLNRNVAPRNATAAVLPPEAEDDAGGGDTDAEQMPLDKILFRFASQCSDGRGMNATDLQGL